MSSASGGNRPPVAYLALFLAVIAGTAAIFSHRDRDELPAYVCRLDQPVSPWILTAENEVVLRISPEASSSSKSKADLSSPLPLYHPLIMSVATVLPGDTLNYLRNFKFVPQNKLQALGVTGLQIVTLVIQGLIVASIASLIGH